MRTFLRPIFAALAGAILIYQLFAPGFAGLADNGDFPRVAGHFSLCPADGWDAYRFRFFVPDYVEQASCHWESEIPTAALLLTYPARAIAPGPRFPIRTLAALHTGILVALVELRPPLLLLCDFANTAYFNSFYLEGFALLALLAVIISARELPRRKTNLAITLYTVAAILLVTSKLQHATLSLPLALFLIWCVRWRAAFPAAAILLGAIYMSAATPPMYKLTNLWSSVFVGLVPNSPAALADLQLSPDYAPFTNRNAYEFQGQQQADLWLTRLGRDMSYGKLAGYYLQHPALARDRVIASARGLKHLRPDYLGNTVPGTPAFAQSHRVDWFSTSKAWLFNRAPYLSIALYAGLAFLIPRPLALLLLAMGSMEFLMSTFADSVLDYRHHALLHQVLDLWVLCAVVRLVDRVISVKKAIFPSYST